MSQLFSLKKEIGDAQLSFGAQFMGGVGPNHFPSFSFSLLREGFKTKDNYFHGISTKLRGGGRRTPICQNN